MSSETTHATCRDNGGGGVLGRRHRDPILGDPPGIDFKNVFYGFFGAEYRFDNLRAGGVVLDVAQAATAAGSDLRQLTVYLARKIDKALTARGYLILGLSDGSPDWGFGGGAIYYGR